MKSDLESDITSPRQEKRKAGSVLNENQSSRSTRLRPKSTHGEQLHHTNQASTDNNPTLVADNFQVVGAQFKMTDDIFSGYCELRKQGWEWTLKSRRPGSSAKAAGVLFLVDMKGQHADAPALLMTDVAINFVNKVWMSICNPRRDCIGGTVVCHAK